MWPAWKKGVWFVAVPGLIAFLGGVAVSKWVPNTKGAVLAMTVGSVGLIFFVSLLFVTHNLSGRTGGLTDFDVRTAIAGAISVVYLTILPILVFSTVEPSEGAQSLLNSFTTLASVVAGFYFGGTALVSFAEAKSRGEGEDVGRTSDPPS